ncbi:MAG: serine/threonine protein kinase [Thermotogae bacterium]|nr:serine/threonine protein kinase [Thermotogota bacterium]
MPLSKGHVLSRKYEIIDFLGRGLIFEVYRARHTRLDREVALKVLIPEVAADLEFTRFIIKTIRATASLDAHPHISWVHDIDKDGVYIFFVMDYLPTDLTSLIDKLDLEASVNVALAVLDALSYAHRHGLIHKDIRPTNVRFSETGEPLLVDFGMAEVAAKAAVKFKKTAYLPPPTYAAPEQIKSFSLADERSDLYSVGALLYHMLTKRPPFEGDIKQIYYQKLSPQFMPPKPRSLNENIPPKLEEAILKAMAYDPQDRFQTADEMLSFLLDVRKRYIARFLPSQYEERRPEGNFSVKYKVRENTPIQIAHVEMPSVVLANVPYKITVSLVGDGKGKIKLDVPEFFSLSAPSVQEFEVPAEVSWYVITTKERYGAYEIALDVESEDVSILERPLKLPILVLPIEGKEKKAGKRTIFNLFGLIEGGE